jgi:hypothetical protein
MEKRQQKQQELKLKGRTGGKRLFKMPSLVTVRTNSPSFLLLSILGNTYY